MFPLRDLFFRILQTVHDSYRLKTIELLRELGFSEDSPDEEIISSLISKDADEKKWDEFESGIKQLLLSTKVPIPGESQIFTFMNSKIPINFPPESDLGLHYSLLNAIEVLPRMAYIDYLFVISSLLFERTVIFVSENRRLLGQAVQYFTASISPLSWPFPVIYSLPDSCREILNSPVPLIAGLLVPYKKLVNEIVPEYAAAGKDLVFVLLDHSALLVGKDTAASTYMPRFNKKFDELHQEIKSLFAESGSHSLSYHSKTRDFSRKSAVKVNKKPTLGPTISQPKNQAVIRTYLQGLHYLLKESLATEHPEDWKLAEEDIRARLGPKDDKFLETFFQTQTFAFSLPHLSHDN